MPAIVYGIFGLAIFVELLGDLTSSEGVEGKSLLSGGLTISIMVLPIVIITTAESLRAVPRSIREAGFGVGATRWEVIRSHVLPNAAPGILTGSVLAMARALGETAPLIMVGAVTGFLATQGGVAETLLGRFTALADVDLRLHEEAAAGIPGCGCSRDPHLDGNDLPREPDRDPAKEPV